ncbi:hypothetical protein D3C84_1187910 [compost metagenome]
MHVLLTLMQFPIHDRLNEEKLLQQAESRFQAKCHGTQPPSDHGTHHEAPLWDSEDILA